MHTMLPASSRRAARANLPLVTIGHRYPCLERGVVARRARRLTPHDSQVEPDAHRVSHVVADTAAKARNAIGPSRLGIRGTVDQAITPATHLHVPSSDDALRATGGPPRLHVVRLFELE